VPPLAGAPATKDLGGALARFGEPDWQVELDPSMIRRADMALSASWIAPRTAAFVAAGIYHEARHAEQTFRVSRLLAMWHERDPLEQFEPDIVKAAATRPLDPRTTSATERVEAVRWEGYTAGDDFAYGMTVEEWLSDVVMAWRAAGSVKNDTAGATRNMIGEFLTESTTKRSGRAWYLHTLLPSARKRGLALIVAHVTKIDRLLIAAQAAFDRLPEGAGPGDFGLLEHALNDLYDAVYAAYADLPIENDALAAGNAVKAACLKWFDSSEPPTPS
jgi:hypothetical protein